MSLMTLKQAEEIREDFRMALESYDECAAEAGMGAVSMGFDGYDGVSAWCQENPPPAPSPEVREADLVVGIFYNLQVYGIDQFNYIGTPLRCRIPEYDPHGTLTQDIPF